MTGFHVRTPDDLARTLTRLVDDGAMRAEVGAQARRVVEERYAMDVVAPAWEQALA